MDYKTFPMKTDICYIISHGFAARMLLQTGLIRRLAREGKQIAIITPDPEDDNLVRVVLQPVRARQPDEG